MNVLGIDGALRSFSAAVAVNGSIRATRTVDGASALEDGLASIADALSEAGIDPAQLDRIACGIGPGRFTGLRIAVAYAKSLALAWRLPLVPAGSFDILEYGLALDPVLAVVEGRTGVISARLRSGDVHRRASGRIEQVLAELFDAMPVPPELATVGAPKDVLSALAERAIVARPFEPQSGPAAVAAALLAGARDPAPNVHAVRADYGELPAAKVPKFA